MQILLAPSKTMDMGRSYPRGILVTQPHFLEEARRIVAAIRGVSDIAHAMVVSQPIADRVTEKYLHWGDRKAPAVFAYIGDVYKWFYADTLSTEELHWAQDHLYIMSGLYGVLRPMDEVSPYRLEMKAKVAVGDSKDIYTFWDKKLAQFVDMMPDEVICNLSSDEYARCVTKYTKKRVVTPVFLDNKTNGQIGTVPIYSKMMRGVLARWIIDHRIDTPEGLQAFASQGYSYNKAKSMPDFPAFYRRTPKPIRF
jgi:cytoplasmic iron level regulating protein YaaA (DUF328/UPF0246 family)